MPFLKLVEINFAVVLRIDPRNVEAEPYALKRTDLKTLADSSTFG